MTANKEIIEEEFLSIIPGKEDNMANSERMKTERAPMSSLRKTYKWVASWK